MTEVVKSKERLQVEKIIEAEKYLAQIDHLARAIETWNKADAPILGFMTRRSDLIRRIFDQIEIEQRFIAHEQEALVK